MAVIKIDNLSVPGTELFADDETYLDRLTDAELNIQGGLITSPQKEREQTLPPTSLSFAVYYY